MDISGILDREVKGTREQAGCDEWFAARVGKITGSGLSKVAPRPHETQAGKWASPIPKFKKEYYQQKLVENITGECYNVDVNAAMEHGVKYEPQAIAHFLDKYEFTIQEVGTIKVVSDLLEEYPFLKMFGVSPDGLLTSGPNIQDWDIPPLEVKCPGKLNHINFLETNKVPPFYFPQVQGEILVADSSYGWFCSYHPEMPREYQMHIVMVPRDQEYIQNKLIPGVDRFLNKIDRGMVKINNNLGICPI